MIHQPSQRKPVTVQSYILGFGLSVLLTLSAYWLVVHHSFSTWTLVSVIGVLAIGQFIAQLVLFLHIGNETGPRWRLLVFGSMLVVIAILVIGSLWIMYNLNYNMMSPQAINSYMSSQDGGI